MTSPAGAVSETFTGTDGNAWPTFANHYTMTGSYSAGPTETIQSNKGQASATASTAVSIRRHRSGAFQWWTRDFPYSNTATFVRSTLSVKPGLTALVGSTDASTNFIAVQAETFTGKSTTYGLAIKKYVSGAWSTLYSLSSVSGADTTSNTMGISMRTWYLGTTGNLLIQAKLWNTSGSEPAWKWPTSDVAGSTATDSAGSIAYVMSSTARAADYASNNFFGMFEETDAAVSYTVDWDDTQSYSWTASPYISSNFGGLTATSIAGARRYWNSASYKADNFEGSAPASFWGTTGTWAINGGTFAVSTAASGSALTEDTGNTVHDIGTLPGDANSWTMSVGGGNYYPLKVRINYSDTFVAVRFNDSGGVGTLSLVKSVSGDVTVLEADFLTPATYASVKTLRLSASGTTFRLVAQAAAGQPLFAKNYTITDASLQTGTSVQLNALQWSLYGGTICGALVRSGGTINRTDLGGLTATAIATAYTPLPAPVLSTSSTLLAPTVSQAGGLPAYVGTGQVEAVYVGTAEATKLYVGSSQVWP